MSNKESKPWSFGLLGGKSGGKSVLALIILIVLAVTTHIAGAIYNEVHDRRARPVLALKSALRDVREFIRVEKRTPVNFRDIEVNLWNKNNPNAPTRLLGTDLLVADNYEYRFFSGKVKGINLMNIWAIPLGKYREQYDTVLLIITDEGEEIWRGPALNESQRNFVISDKAFPTTFPQLSQMNMKKDATAAPAGQSKKPGIFK